MRIRQIKPDFFRDREMAGLTADQREFYVGLWLEADDSGWLRWDVVQIGADLYPFRGATHRERQAAKWGDLLDGMGKIQRYACGHAYLPTFTKHQHFSGASKQVHTYRNDHARCSPPLPEDSRGDPPLPASKVKVESKGKGTGGVGGENPNDEIDALRTGIAMNQEILSDPLASEEVKRAARKFLMTVGADVA